MKKNVMLTPLVGNDTLTGTSVDDRIDGGAGDDTYRPGLRNLKCGRRRDGDRYGIHSITHPSATNEGEFTWAA